MVAIILVNWNGYKDTIECLDSLQQCIQKDFFVVVCDNGSTNDSISRISQYCADKWPFDSIDFTDKKPDISINRGHVILYKLGQNNGFSRGNNLGIKFASMFNPDYYLLLNNDTIVEPDFLSLLVDFQKKNSQYKVLTPLIHYYYDKHLIWNGGGNIYWGFRIYHFADKNESVIPHKESLPCTYITGCALFFAPEVLDEENRLLTEKFFFGEEDFEFGLRMMRAKVKMACVLNSIIYHKVGGSRNNDKAKIGHTFIHYLNRLIDVKSYLPSWQYVLYRFVFSLNVVRILILRYKMPCVDIVAFIKKLNSEAKRLDGVSRDYFLKTVSKELGG